MAAEGFSDREKQKEASEADSVGDLGEQRPDGWHSGETVPHSVSSAAGGNL